MDGNNFYNNETNETSSENTYEQATPQSETYQNTYNSYNGYSYGGSTGDGGSTGNGSAAPEPGKQKKKKEKKAKSSFGFGKKFVAAICLGAVFGACAAGSFYAVDTYVIKNTESTEADSTDLSELEATVAKLEQSVYGTSTSTVSTTTATTVTTDVTSVVDKVMPSMVAVTNTAETTTRDIWGRSYTDTSESAGSGIIVGESDTEYFIATNHHVIEDAKTLEVTFNDDSTAEAYVKGYDSSMDIAVIAVLKENLTDDTKNAITVAELGDSDSLKIGEPAIAIGNALGYGQSVTTGVVSALGRNMTIDSVTYENLIQTSAAINPGNSGGALLNIQGQVIGINSSKIGGSTVEGMGFAIPINEVKDIISEFSARETRTKVDDSERGYLGIGSGTQYDLTAYGYPEGVYVATVYEGSPAETAGVYMGDIITKCDGQTVSDITALQEMLSYYSAGETVTLTITRNVQGSLTELEIPVTLGTQDVITNNQ